MTPKTKPSYRVEEKEALWHKNQTDKTCAILRFFLGLLKI
jgi:hypothetical protein